MKNLIIFLFALVNCPTLFSQDASLKRLNDSPRHHEWATIKNGDRKVKCFIAYPEIKEKATTVIVIHENRGLTDWVRSFTDQLAEAGYLAIAPDLLSDFDTIFKSTSEFPNSDEARNAIYKLNQQQVSADLNAVVVYATKNQASNGKVVIAGFCWGGSQSFKMATNNITIKAACVFYGSAPESVDDINRITVPVYGFYAENDERINAGIPATEKMMKAAGKTYDYVIYPGAGHAFMRMGEDTEGSAENKLAREKAWGRLLNLLKEK